MCDKLLERHQYGCDDAQDIWQESGKEYLQLREVRQIQIKIFKICENYLPAKDSRYIIISQPNANPLCPIIITQAHQFLVRQKTQLQKKNFFKQEHWVFWEYCRSIYSTDIRHWTKRKPLHSQLFRF